MNGTVKALYAAGHGGASFADCAHAWVLLKIFINDMNEVIERRFSHLLKTQKLLVVPQYVMNY